MNNNNTPVKQTPNILYIHIDKLTNTVILANRTAWPTHTVPFLIHSNLILLIFKRFYFSFLLLSRENFIKLISILEKNQCKIKKTNTKLSESNEKRTEVNDDQKNSQTNRHTQINKHTHTQSVRRGNNNFCVKLLSGQERFEGQKGV